MKIKTKYIHKGKYKQNMAKSEVGEREWERDREREREWDRETEKEEGFCVFIAL